jgi:hypothetical protein
MIVSFSFCERHPAASLNITAPRHKTVFHWEKVLEPERRKCALSTATTSTVRDELSDGRDVGLDSAVLGHQVRFAAL